MAVQQSVLDQGRASRRGRNSGIDHDTAQLGSYERGSATAVLNGTRRCLCSGGQRAGYAPAHRIKGLRLR